MFVKSILLLVMDVLLTTRGRTVSSMPRCLKLCGVRASDEPVSAWYKISSHEIYLRDQVDTLASLDTRLGISDTSVIRM